MKLWQKLQNATKKKKKTAGNYGKLNQGCHAFRAILKFKSQFPALGDGKEGI